MNMSSYSDSWKRNNAKSINFASENNNEFFAKRKYSIIIFTRDNYYFIRGKLFYATFLSPKR